MTYKMKVVFRNEKAKDLKEEAEKAFAETQDEHTLRVTNGHRRWVFPCDAIQYVEFAEE